MCQLYVSAMTVFGSYGDYLSVALGKVRNRKYATYLAIEYVVSPTKRQPRADGRSVAEHQ